MLVDYLEDASAGLRALEQRLMRLDKEYKLFFDRDIKEQMYNVKKEIAKERINSFNYLYRHLQELVLVKKRFPDFFQVLKEDQYLSKVIGRLDWLLDFKKLESGLCQVELQKIKGQRRQLRDMRDFLKTWVGKLDKKSIKVTWPVLQDGALENAPENMDKDEFLQAIRKKNRELKRKGWLFLLNEPFIAHMLDGLFTKLKQARQKEAEKKMDFEKAKGRGIYSEHDAEKSLRTAKKERVRMERKCEHLLLANYEYFQKLKKQRITWRDKVANVFLKDLVAKIDVPPLDEKKWFMEMEKRLALK